MLFKGISKDFSLINEDQYNTIGNFWDEMSLVYGLENLIGLGYLWNESTISYAIGLKQGVIKNYIFTIEVPDSNWEIEYGETSKLKEMYDKIYKTSAVLYELETFYENGKCEIRFIRRKKKK